jgi:hypothetical protein
MRSKPRASLTLSVRLELVTAVPNWKPGDQLFDSSHTRYSVLDVVDLTDVVDQTEETESFLGALVVTPIELAEPNP